MMSLQNRILKISALTIASLLGALSAPQAIASEINFSDQVNTQINLGDYQAELATWDLQDIYGIAQRPLDLERFCRDYPFNSRCEGRVPEAIETEQEQTAPILDDKNQVRGDNWAVLTNASTLGLGGALVAKVNSNLNARVGVNAFSFDVTIEETEVSYDGQVDLFNVLTALDIYPFKNSGFYTSVGVVFNNNNADGVADAAEIVDVDLGELNIAANELLDVNADISTSRNFAPYVGIGWGNPIAGGLRFWANLGVMFPGSPDVELSPDFQIDESLIPDDINQEITDSIEEEQEDLEDELEGFNIFPIVSIGLSYSF